MNLKTKNRDILGKKVKLLRREGLIPTELFGHGFENKHLSVSEKEFKKVFEEAGKTMVINVELEDGNKIPALIHEIQRNPISEKFISVNLYKVKTDEKIQTEVPVEFVGEAPALKAGLLIVKVLSEIEMEAFPQDIPRDIEVSLESLEKGGDAIRIKDLKFPKGIKVLTDPETVVANTAEKKEEETSAAPEEAVKKEEGLTPEVSAKETTEAGEENKKNGEQK